MDMVLWVVAGVLASAGLVGGLAELSFSKEKYRGFSQSLHWVDDFPVWFIKCLGLLKLAIALGLVLPAATGVATYLVPLSALGMMLIMAGATAVRMVRQEWRYLPVDLFILILGACIAWGRAFSSASFL